MTALQTHFRQLPSTSHAEIEVGAIAEADHAELRREM